MNISRWLIVGLLSCFLETAPLAFAGSILIGTALPAISDSLSPVPSCGQLICGQTGYVLDDRQRLAESFTFNSPVHVESVMIGVSASYWTNSQIDVFVTDGITTGNSFPFPVHTYVGESIYPAFDSSPQTITVAVSADLLPSITYYIVLDGHRANAETNPGHGTPLSGAGTLGASYYANSGLGQSPFSANWASLAFPAISFELTGTPTPEPNTGWAIAAMALTGVVLTMSKHIRQLRFPHDQ
jgi:hypothetical protein